MESINGASRWQRNRWRRNWTNKWKMKSLDLMAAERRWWSSRRRGGGLKGGQGRAGGGGGEVEDGCGEEVEGQWGRQSKWSIKLFLFFPIFYSFLYGTRRRPRWNLFFFLIFIFEFSISLFIYFVSFICFFWWSLVSVRSDPRRSVPFFWDPLGFFWDSLGLRQSFDDSRHFFETA